MYVLLDLLLTLLHLVIIGFNLLGWIWRATRKLHFYVILATAFSWLVLGIWFGIGYCPITDWQWQVKKELGEKDLPNSFIKYIVDKLTGLNSDADWIDTITAISFAIVTLLSIYLKFFHKRNKKL
ncbi:DUF2784 domain-containing protein [Olivibacter sp. SDN3]|uniref:DUF2784 domain-containing protein n=1 Tax=Olivibacter sp. SDN3 TaxID=2764720 RepID=UPI001651A4E1|nr:DUF2784 domain-containing protein [Olivibacter sp. SDN3]QNL49045.1 DUF2784 domain-containing protein [Olivibacter sp. SDN3]